MTYNSPLNNFRCGFGPLNITITFTLLRCLSLIRITQNTWTVKYKWSSAQYSLVYLLRTYHFRSSSFKKSHVDPTVLASPDFSKHGQLLKLLGTVGLGYPQHIFG